MWEFPFDASSSGRDCVMLLRMQCKAHRKRKQRTRPAIQTLPIRATRFDKYSGSHPLRRSLQVCQSKVIIIEYVRFPFITAPQQWVPHKQFIERELHSQTTDT